MDIQGRIQQAALQFFLGVLYSSAGDQAPFKALITIDIDGERKPLLLAGTAHSRVEDGSCIAIVNPDPELIDQVYGGLGGNPGVFKEIIAKRCDFALALWIDAYMNNRVLVGARYKNRTPAPAKFAVNEISQMISTG